MIYNHHINLSCLIKNSHQQLVLQTTSEPYAKQQTDQVLIKLEQILGTDLISPHGPAALLKIPRKYDSLENTLFLCKTNFVFFPLEPVPSTSFFSYHAAKMLKFFFGG